ncbi:MAG: hypothetical protein ACRD1P_04060 [Thermoanaerobaculia bacterium]
MKRRLLIPAALLAIALAPACTNKQAETEQSVILTVDLTDQAGLTNINPPHTITIPTMNVNSRLKSPTASNPVGMADVLLSYYVVHYHRNDGGTRLPADQTFAAGLRLATPGTVTMADFPVLSQAAVEGAPFNSLVPANGGIDPETGKTEIDLFYDVTFFGQTVAGQSVQSETATAIRIFQYF